MTDKDAEMDTENKRLQGTIAGLELQVKALKKAAGEERKKNLLKDLNQGKSKQALLAQGHQSHVNIKKGEIGSGMSMLKAAPGSLLPAGGKSSDSAGKGNLLATHDQEKKAASKQFSAMLNS